jgi:hypothetical protein
MEKVRSRMRSTVENGEVLEGTVYRRYKREKRNK